VIQQWISVVWFLGSVAWDGALVKDGTSWLPLGASGIPGLLKTSYCFPDQQEAKSRNSALTSNRKGY